MNKRTIKINNNKKISIPRTISAIVIRLLHNHSNILIWKKNQGDRNRNWPTKTSTKAELSVRKLSNIYSCAIFKRKNFSKIFKRKKFSKNFQSFQSFQAQYFFKKIFKRKKFFKRTEVDQQNEMNEIFDGTSSTAVRFFFLLSEFASDSGLVTKSSQHGKTA